MFQHFLELHVWRRYEAPHVQISDTKAAAIPTVTLLETSHRQTQHNRRLCTDGSGTIP